MDLSGFGEAEEDSRKGGVVVRETRLAGEGVKEVESALRIGLGGD